MDGRGLSSRRARGDSGASAVEYGLLIAGAGVVLVALSFATGKAVSGAFLTNATAVGGTPGVVGAAPTSGSAAPTTTSASPTTSSASPTPTPTTLARNAKYSEDYNPGLGYSYSSCSVIPSGTGTCGYTNTFRGSDTLDFDPKNNTPAGTLITVSWTITSSRGGADVVITRTFVLS